MKKNLSIFNLALLFIPIQLTCSENEPTSLSGIINSPQVKNVTHAIGTVTLFAVRKGYEAATLAIQYAQNQQDATLQQTISHVKMPADDACDSDASSGSDSEASFTMLETTKKKKSFYRDQNELQKSLHDKPNEAIHKLNQSMTSFFKEQDPESSAIQKDILHMITLLKESACNGGKELALASVIADEYNEQQKTILINKVQDHALKIEPRIEEEYANAIKLATQNRDSSIEKANKKYDKLKKFADERHSAKLIKILAQAKTIAHNSQYINNCATNKKNHKAHNEAYYETPESYKTLLAEIRLKKSEKNENPSK